MKRLLSLILIAVLSAVLGSHNSVMAVGGGISMSMGNHSGGMLESHLDHSMSLYDCESICCIHNDSALQIGIINLVNNKKLFNKLKYSFIELSFDQSFIYEWNLIGNISPPILVTSEFNSNYSTLTGIIKSNT